MVRTLFRLKPGETPPEDAVVRSNPRIDRSGPRRQKTNTAKSHTTRAKSQQEIREEDRQLQQHVQQQEEERQRRQDEEARTEENTRRAMEQVSKMNLAIPAESSAEPQGLQVPGQLTEHQRQENIRDAIRKLIKPHWTRYISLLHASEHHEVGALQKAEAEARQMIEIVEKRFNSSDLEQTLKFSYGPYENSADREAHEKWVEIMPAQGRYFSRNGKVWIPPRHAFIAHRVAALHGFRKSDWEDHMNRTLRF